MSSNIHQASQEVPLCKIADIRLGHPFRGTIRHFDDGDVKVIQTRDTDATGEIKHTHIITTRLSTKKQPDWLQNGDVLFVAKGAKHHSALVENVREYTLCSPHFFVVRLKSQFRNEILPEFLCWQLNQLPAQRYFKTTAEGSMYLSIRRQVLEDIQIKLLPIEKQKQLTAMHSCSIKEQKALLRLIENRRQQIDAIAIKALQDD